MSSDRSPRRYRTARERVGTRPTRRPIRPKRATGCGSIVVGLMLAVLLGTLVVALFARRATQTLDVIQQSDPRQQGVQNPEQGNPAAALPTSLREPFNVLLIGVDKRDDPDEGVRSDTLIVVHVDPDDRWASMLSVPRDSVASVPGLGQQKINTAYAYGYVNATELYGQGTDPSAAAGAFAAETIEGFLGIKIGYIAQIDFRGFERVVDTFGGITVDVPQPLLDAGYPTEDAGYERIYIPAGLQVLDGHTALQYARSRHTSSDFDRSRRQQQVLRAMLSELRRRGLLGQASLLPELANDLEESVSTTLPITDLSALQGLAALAQAIPPDRIMQLSINPEDVAVVSEQGSDIYWNQDDIALQVARFLAGPEAISEVARVQVQNGTGVRGLATKVTNNLTTEGFVMTQASDATQLYEHTTVIDYTGRPQTLQRLTDVLGIEPRYVQSELTPDTPNAPYNTDIVVILGQDYQERWAGGQ